MIQPTEENSMRLMPLIIKTAVLLFLTQAGRGADAVDNWTASNSNTSEGLGAVVYAQQTFVAVGANGAIVTSANGINWTPRSSGTTIALNAIAFGSPGFVAVGGYWPVGGAIITSRDGLGGWTAQDPGVVSAFNDVTYGAGQFVAVGG
jgi:hypothetical protein